CALPLAKAKLPADAVGRVSGVIRRAKCHDGPVARFGKQGEVLADWQNPYPLHSHAVLLERIAITVGIAEQLVDH
ncbi:MAG: hypothetical protein GTO41_17500, partial [Burkholderiales bacterium]|nr:hypothetical protein [Burkholderiales bacterium]